ncbi:MAG: hypothetical protein ACLRWP_16875 [Bilophila wadsworthia]
MHATLPGRYANGLIMELPLYHRPNFRTIFGNVCTRAVLFLRGAVVNIFAALIVVAISTFLAARWRRAGCTVSGGGWNPSVRFWGLTGGLRSRC